MGLMTDVRSVAANSKADNVLSGKTEELVTRPSLVSVAIVGSAAGLRATVVAGGQVIIDDQEVSNANRFPIIPDDVVAEFGVTGPADRLVISLRNTTGAAITGQTKVSVQPIA